MQVVWRLVKVAVVLAPVSVCHGLPDPSSASRVALFLLQTVLPALVLLAAAALCRWRRTAPWWRAHVVAACVLAYGSLSAADLAIEYADWTVKAKDFQTMWQLLWFLMFMVVSWTLFALDLAEVALVLSLQWLLYAAVTIGSYYKWWVESDQGPGVYSFSSTPAEDTSSALHQLHQECTWMHQRTDVFVDGAPTVEPLSPLLGNLSAPSLPPLESSSGYLTEDASNLLDAQALVRRTRP